MSVILLLVPLVLMRTVMCCHVLATVHVGVVVSAPVTMVSLGPAVTVPLVRTPVEEKERYITPPISIIIIN